MLRHVLGYTNGEGSAPLKLGTAMHAALAVHLEGFQVSSSFAVFEAEYREWAEANLEDANPRSWQNVSRIVSHWLLNHPLADLPYEVVKVNGTPIVERPIRAELQPDVVFVGTLDALVRDKATGLIYVLDHKTTTWDVNPTYERQFHMGSQLSGYLWIGQQLVEQLGLKEPITGALINAIQIRKIPDSDRKCKLHGLKYNQCGLLHLGSQLLGPYTRTQEQLSNWLRQADRLVDVVEENKFRAVSLINNGYMMRQQEGQFNGHCSNCEFFDFCRRGRPWGKLDSLYKKNPGSLGIGKEA